MEAIWEIIAPYITTVCGATGASAVIYVLLRSLLSKIVKKNTSTLGEMFNSDKLSNQCAEKMVGKTLNIDVTAVTEKALKKMQDKLEKKTTELAETTNSYKHLLALMGNAMTKLKALSTEEISALEKAVKELDSEYVPTEVPEPLVIKLEPLELETKTVSADELKGGVNFDGVN